MFCPCHGHQTGARWKAILAIRRNATLTQILAGFCTDSGHSLKPAGPPTAATRSAIRPAQRRLQWLILWDPVDWRGINGTSTGRVRVCRRTKSP